MKWRSVSRSGVVVIRFVVAVSIEVAKTSPRERKAISRPVGETENEPIPPDTWMTRSSLARQSEAMRTGTRVGSTAPGARV